MNRARGEIDGLNAQAIRFAIRRHVFVAVPVDFALKQTLIDVVQNRDAMRRETVVLRDDALANGRYDGVFFRAEETNRRDIVDRSEEHTSELQSHSDLV